MKRLICVIVAFSNFLLLTSCGFSAEEKNSVMELSGEITDEESVALLSNSESLPIGTVVLLKNTDHKVMINGVMHFDGDDYSQMFDYSGVLYPEGLIDYEHIYMFNQDDIDKVYFLGYYTEEQEEFQKSIDEAKENYEKMDLE